jgi:lysyl-tRNA synthetase, class II
MACYLLPARAIQILAKWSGLSAGEEDESAAVSVAGRIMAKRVFGKLAFFSLQVSIPAAL